MEVTPRYQIISSSFFKDFLKLFKKKKNKNVKKETMVEKMKNWQFANKFGRPKLE